MEVISSYHGMVRMEKVEGWYIVAAHDQGEKCGEKKVEQTFITFLTSRLQLNDLTAGV